MDIVEIARRVGQSRIEFEMMKRHLDREVNGADAEILRAAARVARRRRMPPTPADKD